MLKMLLPLLPRAMANSMSNEAAYLQCHFSRVSNLLEAKCLLCSLIISCLKIKEWGLHLFLHMVHLAPPLTSQGVPEAQLAWVCHGPIQKHQEMESLEEKTRHYWIELREGGTGGAQEWRALEWSLGYLVDHSSRRNAQHLLRTAEARYAS